MCLSFGFVFLFRRIGHYFYFYFLEDPLFSLFFFFSLVGDLVEAATYSLFRSQTGERNGISSFTFSFFLSFPFLFVGNR